MHTSIVWLRRDLRLDDNPALVAAAKRGAVIPLYIWAPHEDEEWQPGGASRWWLHKSLTEFSRSLAILGSPLVVRRGDSLEQLRAVASESGADAVYWNRRYESTAVERDRQIKNALRGDGVDVQSFNGSLLWEPWKVKTGAGGPYKVFTPFFNACMRVNTDLAPGEAPGSLRPPTKLAVSSRVDDIQLQPRVDWAAGMREQWSPGEAGAKRRLQEFDSESVAQYGNRRDIPSVEGTSRLSAHLSFGEISPRRVWQSIGDRVSSSAETPAFLRQLVWREFAHHLLYHFPQTTMAPLRPEYERFAWLDDESQLKCWQSGITGYPIVDAGMRELWATGWMHNRVRMITASFLVKDLLIRWQHGARWFWDTLVDADLANNTLGWQWVAGSGADAAPYFRVFNPVNQGKKFDPSGDYVRRWVPELQKLPNQWIHAPWTAPAGDLQAAGVELGSNYPLPIVDHAAARQRALEALSRIRS